jgi:hypothetical protein
MKRIKVPLPPTDEKKKVGHNGMASLGRGADGTPNKKGVEQKTG